MTRNGVLLFIVTLNLIGVALIVGLVIPLRRRSYLRWPTAARWMFLSAVTGFALLGATLWIVLWYERHPVLGISQFVLCAVVFWRQIMAPRSVAETAETPSPHRDV